MADLHTFVFADLAGFTAYTEAHGDEAAADLVADFADRCRRLADAATAQQIKALGDGVMLRAATPSSAVQLAARIVTEVGARDRFPAVRIGVHTGTAVERDGDWFGAGVNVAARIAAMATAGEVLVSEQTAGWATGESFERLGSVELRNVALPLTVFRLGTLTSALTVDPVCRMLLAQQRAATHLEREERDWYFCSTACAEAFESHPERYR